ncbi:MAG: glycosyltransferase [Oscillospiraceae bacterium]|nr:glycosyltransferase [Oscillospiraceae bacterium]
MEALHLISGGDSGGAMTHVLTLLSQLNTDGQALLLTLGDGPLPREAKRRGIPCRVLTGGFLSQLRQTEAACRRSGPRVLHCHGSRANLCGALLRRRLACPVISTIHSDPRLDYRGRPAAALCFGGLNALALRKMDALVCVSRSMAETMAARGFPEGRLFTIYNGLDPHPPEETVRRADWRAEHGIPPSALLVGTAARMEAVKDLPTLLRGFAALAKEDKNAYLALAGTGREEASLRRLGKELGLEERLRFLGWVEDMDSFYSALDLFALSSRSETFPFVLLSAARCGLPVVAAEAGGVPELIRHGTTGLLFPPGDSAALGRALNALSGDAARRAALGAALRERGRNFTPRAMGEKMREIYKEIRNHHIEGERQ